MASSLLDAYEQRQESRCLNMAVSAAEYVRNELYWTEGSTVAGFSYPLPGVRSKTHNANLLAAALLCRVRKHTGDEKFLGPPSELLATRREASMRMARGLTGRWRHNDGMTIFTLVTTFARCSPFADTLRQLSLNPVFGAALISIRLTFSAKTVQSDTFMIAPIPSTFTVWRRASSRFLFLKISTRAMSRRRVRYSDGP